MLAARGEYKPAVEKEYGCFTTTLEAVGASLLLLDCPSDAVKVGLDAADATHDNVKGIMKKKVTFEGDNDRWEKECWQFAHFGECAFGDKCRPRPPVVHKQTKAAQTEAERPSKICMLAQEAHWKRDAIKGIPKKIFCLKVC